MRCSKILICSTGCYVVDMNDAPVVASLQDQSVREGEALLVTLPSPFVSDEDSFYSGVESIELLVNDDKAPDWIAFDATVGSLSVNPRVGDEGTYTFTIRVVDLFGLATSRSFAVRVLAANAANIAGTGGRDTFVVSLGNSSGNGWAVWLNGDLAYSSTTANALPLSLDGKGGEDTLIVIGSSGDDAFLIRSNLTIANARPIKVASIESRLIQGRDGADTFSVDGIPSLQTVLDGGDGANSIVSLSEDNQWTLTGAGSGSLNSVSFNRIQSLRGGIGVDQLQIEKNGYLSGVFDGSEGADRIIYGPGTGRVETLVHSFVDLAGATSRLGGFRSVERIEGQSGLNNQISYAANYDASTNVFWNVNAEDVSLSIGFLPSRISLIGFSNLVGTSLFDLFTVRNGASQTSINGGDGFDLVQYIDSDPVLVNLANSSATGISHFSGIEIFQVFRASDSIVIGPDQDSTWSIDYRYSVTVSSPSLANDVTLFGFRRMNAGNQDDRFTFNQVASIAQDPPTLFVINSGAGRNMLDYALSSLEVRVDLSNNLSSFTESVSGFVDVLGSPYNDRIVGNSMNNILIGFSGNDMLSGLAGNDVLFGGSGDDVLIGGTGNDWLLGGEDADNLDGGSGDDLVIGGIGNAFWSYWNDDLVLRRSQIDAVMAEWNSVRSYQQRIRRLTEGVGKAKSVKLNSATLVDDGTVDTLSGGAGDDWFWAGSNDLIADLGPNETRSQHL